MFRIEFGPELRDERESKRGKYDDIAEAILQLLPGQGAVNIHEFPAKNVDSLKSCLYSGNSSKLWQKVRKRLETQGWKVRINQANIAKDTLTLSISVKIDNAGEY